MRAVSIQCPNCGARLSVAANLAQARCEYCGTVSRVQHRTRVFEIARPLPPPQRGQNQLPVAVQMHSRAWYLGLILPIVITAFASGMAYFIQKKVRDNIAAAQGRAKSMRGTTSVATGDAFTWSGMGPNLVYDVNGDGILDPVGRLRYVGDRDAITIGALDARTGKQLFESESLGTYSDTYQGPLALHGRTLLFADAMGKMSAYSVADGARLWQIALGERTDRFCALAGRDDVALIKTADKKRQLVALATGSLEAAPESSGCETLPTDAYDSGEHGTRVAHVKVRWNRKRTKAAGMTPNFAMRHLDGPTFVFGARYPGTSVPMVGRVEGDALSWKVNLAAGNPMEAEDRPPELATVTRDAAIAMYEMRDDTVYLTRLAAADGARAWNVAMPRGLGNRVYRGIVATDHHVFISSWGRLDTFDLETGNHLYHIGR